MSSIPILDLSEASEPRTHQALLDQLHDALFNVGFLYIKNHAIPQATIDDLINILPSLFALPAEDKLQVSKLNSPHFLGYNGYAEESTLGQKDLREQFDFATELPVIYDESASNNNEVNRDLSQLYWRLRGPNQWPDETKLPGFRDLLMKYGNEKIPKQVADTELCARYHDAVSRLSYEVVHLIEEAFEIPVGTFDHLFTTSTDARSDSSSSSASVSRGSDASLSPQHRIKLLHYPPVPMSEASTQGVGAHKDSSGWLTFLYQAPHPEGGLSVLSSDGQWIAAPPIPGTFVVNIGNAFEAATEGAIRATVHRVDAPRTQARYSVPFFMGLPLDLTVSEIRALMPEEVKRKGRERNSGDDGVSAFLDPRWDSLGESQLRKWIRSHEDVGRKWYGDIACNYYTS